jgi:hypothetical protein
MSKQPANTNTQAQKEDEQFNDYKKTMAIYTTAGGTLTLPDGKAVIVTQRTDPNRNLGI